MISQIINDLYEVPITLVSRRGWGKSSSVKTIVQKLLDGNPETIVKVFDPSLNWYHSSPTKFRQYVDLSAITEDRVSNIGSCVYGLNLTTEDTRSFIASIVQSDYIERLEISLRFGDLVVKTLPAIIYIFEEANILFSTNSLRKADQSSEIFNKFISIGRNLGLGGIFITTKAKELSPACRDRSKVLIGKVLGESDLRWVKSISSKTVMESSKSLQKYHWLYGQNPTPFRIYDECTGVPIDYKARGRKPQAQPQPIPTTKNDQPINIYGNSIPKWKQTIAYLILGISGIAGALFVVSVVRFSLLFSVF